MRIDIVRTYYYARYLEKRSWTCRSIVQGPSHSFATTSELLHPPERLGEAHQVVEVVTATARARARARARDNDGDGGAMAAARAMVSDGEDGAMATATATAGTSGNVNVSAPRRVVPKVANMRADRTGRAVIFDAS